MKLSLEWLKEYLDLNVSPEAIAEGLTLGGLEVEGIEKTSNDLIFEISLTPNLGHCMNVIGVARELSAILKLPLKRKKISFEEIPETTDENIQIKIDSPKECLRYSCRLVKDVRVGPSPPWLVEKLTKSGLRSVNNVVDIGNLVMLELGQPLHLFDYDKIGKKTLHVKSAKNLDTIKTLDEVERDIPDGALLICDANRPIAFAGVMGDFDSSVSESTQNILIEGAHFTPESVRKTSKLLNLRTESSIRFERGIDPLTLSLAIDYSAQLLKELADGKICKGIVNQIIQEYHPRVLSLDVPRTNNILGTALSIGEIGTLLKRLEIEILSETDHALKLQIPSYRNDLTSEIDLIEEVGRMYGFNNIPRSLPKHVSSTMKHAPLFVLEEEVRTKLVAQGLQECLTCDLISPSLAKITVEKGLNAEAQIHVLHPSSIDQSILRTTLLPGLLEMAKFNLDRQNQTISTFEVGHIHFKDKQQYFSEPVAGILLTGLESPYHFETNPAPADFFHLKGHIENLLESIGIQESLFEPSHLQNFHPERQARIKIGTVQIGVLGEVHPKHLRELGITQKVYYGELNLHDLLQLKPPTYQVSKISNFPGIKLDWTITLDEATPIGTLIREVEALSSPIRESVFLLKLYRDEKIGKNKKNVTLRFQYRDPKKTITFPEVEKEHQRLTQSIAKKLGDRVI